MLESYLVQPLHRGPVCRRFWSTTCRSRALHTLIDKEAEGSCCAKWVMELLSSFLFSYSSTEIAPRLPCFLVNFVSIDSSTRLLGLLFTTLQPSDGLRVRGVGQHVNWLKVSHAVRSKLSSFGLGLGAQCLKIRYLRVGLHDT